MSVAKVYGLGMRKIISGSINFTGDTIKCALVGATYTPDQDLDEFWSDVATDEVSGTGYTAGGVTLAGKVILAYSTLTNTTGWDCDDPAWTALTLTTPPAGARYAVFYKSTGSAASSPLLSYIDFGTDQNAAGDNVSIVVPVTGIAQFTAL